MLEGYLASDEDLRAVEEGIGHVWDPKLDFIFKNKKFVEEVVIISYDSRNFYLWRHKTRRVNFPKASTIESLLSSYRLFKIPHEVKISDEAQYGWRYGFSEDELGSLSKVITLPKNQQVHSYIISGSLRTPFIGMQKIKSRRMKELNPYTTRESYLATIVHEFGHFYFDRHRTWWYSDKNENLNYLERALRLYEGGKIRTSPVIRIPNYADRTTLLSELFAFCADYSAASIFWERHRKDIDVSNTSVVRRLRREEKKKNLFRENSVLDPSPHAHSAALVIGKMLVDSCPKTWPRILENVECVVVPT